MPSVNKTTIVFRQLEYYDEINGARPIGVFETLFRNNGNRSNRFKNFRFHGSFAMDVITKFMKEHSDFIHSLPLVDVTIVDGSNNEIEYFSLDNTLEMMKNLDYLDVSEYGIGCERTHLYFDKLPKGVKTLAVSHSSHVHKKKLNLSQTF